MSKQTVKVKGVMERDQAVGYLEDLVAGLKAGRVCVQQEDRFVTLCPEGLISVEVEASIKKGKEKFELELSWRKEEQPQVPTDMKISASEPETSALDTSGPEEDALPAVSALASELPPATSAIDEAGKAPSDKGFLETQEEKVKPVKKTK